MSTPHGFFGHPEKLFNHFATFPTLHVSLMFDEDNESSSSRKDTLLNNPIVTYTLTDYLSYRSGTHSRQHPS